MKPWPKKPYAGKTVSLFLFSSLSVLTACSGGGSDSGNEGDVVSTPPPVSSSSSSSSGSSSSGSSSGGGPVLYENFGDDQFTAFDEADTEFFFSQEYKALNANNSEDTRPSFYYPTCCFFLNDNPADGPEVALEQMGIVSDNGNPSMLLDTGRFTAGQTRPDIEAADPKKDSTTSSDVTSWGELDLSRDYRISFCVKEAAGSRKMQIYVDNNTTSSDSSFWGSDSRIFDMPMEKLIPGKRVEINIPGNTYTEPGAELVDFRPDLMGGPSSFLQFRVEGGSTVIFDDLLVEYQDEDGQANLPECNVFTSATAPDVPTAPVLTAGDARVIVDWSEIVGASSYDLAYNTSDSTVDATLVEGITDIQHTLEGLANDTQYFVYVRAKNSAGTSDWSPSASATPAEPIGCSPTTQVNTTTNWGVWDGCLAPNATGAVVVNGSTPTSFAVTEGDEIYYTANDNGTTTFDTTVDAAVNPTANLADVMSDSSAGYPRHFTWIGRINTPTSSARGFEVEISFGETDGRRVKAILRPDGGKMQLEKFTDGTNTAEGDMEMLDGYHIYQVALTLNGAADVTARVYRDGENVSGLFSVDTTATEISGTGRDGGSSSPRLRIGEGSSSAYKANVDWLIWTDDASTAAMTPAELAGQLPEGIGELGPYAPAQ